MTYGRISKKQQEILDYMKNEILNRGFPPSVREICEAVNLKSTSSVHSHLEALEKNGYIRRDATKPRAIEIIDDNFNLTRREVVNVPILGNVAAGQPLLAVENIETYFPEAANYSTDYSTGNFEITMQSGPGTSVANPYMRCRFFMSSDYNDLEVNFSGNFGHYQNDRVDEILAAIPHETDDAKLKDYYTELSKIMLEDCPCVPLMYRPQVFHEVNESVWTNYPQKDDGTNVPPMDCTDGYGVAALYNLELIDG